MAYRIELTKLAAEDLERILQWTFDQWGPGQYSKYESQLLAGFSSLADDPGGLLSKSRNDLYKGAWLFSVGEHYLVYSISEETVIIERILYQGMDLPRRLEE